jgi:hypothetical protein
MKTPSHEADVLRFWRYVDKSGECWVWTGTRCSQKPWSIGYGQFRAQRKNIRAHRFSFQIHFGPIPAGKFVLHRCDNSLCVNPTHLFLGDVITNAADMIQKGRSATGPRHGTHTRPDRIARAFGHGSKTHPERIARGSDLPHTKLTIDQVRRIKERYAAGERSARTLAEGLPVSPRTIRAILSSRTWKHV